MCRTISIPPCISGRKSGTSFLIIRYTIYGIPYDTAQRHFRGELTDEEFVNAVFEPQEQVNVAQAQLLEAAFMLASGGPTQAHSGTGGGGSQSDLPWGEKGRNGCGI